MKISVVIPVFNGGKTLKRCLESVLRQTLSDIEVIVVNDGSTDNTPDIIASFEGRVKVIEQANLGQGFARNAGLDAASGEYVGFLDADDTVEDTMYEAMYAAAEENDADIVQCNLINIYPDGKKLTQLSDFEGVVDVSDNADYMARFMAGYIHSYEVCNKIFSREFSERNKLRFGDTKKYFSEDMLFNMEAVKYLRRICFIKEPYYNYYQNADSHMHANAGERLCKMLDLFDEYIDGAEGEMKASASYLAAMATMYNIGKCENVTGEEAYARLENYIRASGRVKKPVKKQLFLTAALYAPPRIKMKLARLLSRG